VIPPKAEPRPGPCLPMTRFKYDAKHQIVRCPRGRTLQRSTRDQDRWYYRSKCSDCRECSVRQRCLSPKVQRRTIVISDGYEALLRARRRRRGDVQFEEAYRRHRWRSEGVHAEAKRTWACCTTRTGQHEDSGVLDCGRDKPQTLGVVIPNAPVLFIIIRELQHAFLTSNSNCRGAFFNSPVVHFYRNVWTLVPTNKVKEVAAMLKAIHAQEERVSARDKVALIAAKLEQMKLAKATELVRESIEETFSYYEFPREHWKCLRTNNPLERLMREIRWLTRVVGAFPDGRSALSTRPAKPYAGELADMPLE